MFDERPVRWRMVHRAAEHDAQSLVGQKLFQPSLGDQRQLPFLEALRVPPDFRRVDAADERNTFAQQADRRPSTRRR